MKSSENLAYVKLWNPSRTTQLRNMPHGTYAIVPPTASKHVIKFGENDYILFVSAPKGVMGYLFSDIELWEELGVHIESGFDSLIAEQKLKLGDSYSDVLQRGFSPTLSGGGSGTFAGSKKNEGEGSAQEPERQSLQPM